MVQNGDAGLAQILDWGLGRWVNTGYTHAYYGYIPDDSPWAALSS
jgi:hypothetical protein